MNTDQTAFGRPRKAWIDVLRALAIFMVVFGHRAGNPDFFLFSGPVKMPLFFALSGYLFKTRGGCDKEFFRRLFWSLVVPWICLAYLPIAITFPVRGISYIWTALIDVVSGAKLWFMPCLIIGEIIFYYLLKWCKDKDILLFIVTMVFFVIGYYLKSYQTLNFAKFNIALTVQVYFLFGYLFRKYEHTLTKTHVIYMFGALVAYIIIGFISRWIYPYQIMNVGMGYYYNIPLCLTMVALGLYALFTLSQRIDHYPAWLQTVGRNSLAIYILDRYALIPFNMFFDFKHSLYSIVFVVTLVYMVWTCLFSITISKILNRYVPWTTGNRG